MGALLWVQVPPRVDHSERSEAQLRTDEQEPTDRLIQQAPLQVLQPVLDPTFSEHSYGLRPGRRAHDAVLAAQSYVQSGRRVVVDVDLEKFFDRVNHDILIERLQKRIGDAGAIG
jgi:RNA-directed DNA polymerase